MEIDIRDRLGNPLVIGSWVVYTTANGGIYFGRIINFTNRKYHIKLRGCDKSYDGTWTLRNPGEVDRTRILCVSAMAIPEEAIALYKELSTVK